jgi:hypothetical protein
MTSPGQIVTYYEPERNNLQKREDFVNKLSAKVWRACKGMSFKILDQKKKILLQMQSNSMTLFIRDLDFIVLAHGSGSRS